MSKHQALRIAGFIDYRLLRVVVRIFHSVNR